VLRSFSCQPFVGKCTQLYSILYKLLKYSSNCSDYKLESFTFIKISQNYIYHILTPPELINTWFLIICEALEGSRIYFWWFYIVFLTFWKIRKFMYFDPMCTSSGAMFQYQMISSRADIKICWSYKIDLDIFLCDWRDIQIYYDKFNHQYENFLLLVEGLIFIKWDI